MPEFFATHFAFITTPEGWAAMVTLIAMEVVLGIDNLIFISILTNKLPAVFGDRGGQGMPLLWMSETLT